MFGWEPDPSLDLYLPYCQSRSLNCFLVSFSNSLLKRVMVCSFSGRGSGARTHPLSWMLHYVDPIMHSTKAAYHSTLLRSQSEWIIKRETYTFVWYGRWIASLSAVEVLMREVFLFIERRLLVDVHDFIELLIPCHFFVSNLRRFYFYFKISYSFQSCGPKLYSDQI